VGSVLAGGVHELEVLIVWRAVRPMNGQAVAADRASGGSQSLFSLAWGLWWLAGV
jgi:hypothetical protein